MFDTTHIESMHPHWVTAQPKSFEEEFVLDGWPILGLIWTQQK